MIPISNILHGNVPKFEVTSLFGFFVFIEKSITLFIPGTIYLGRGVYIEPRDLIYLYIRFCENVNYFYNAYTFSSKSN